jgi:hypothetical protein
MVLTYAWGARYWDAMLLAAMGYNDQPTSDQQKAMADWLTNTMQILPCPGCSQHAIAYVAKHPPKVESKTVLIEWIVEFHNFVNVSLKKPTMTVPEAMAALIKRLAQELINRNNTIVPNPQPNQTTTSSNEQLYFGLTITFAVLTGIFLIALIVVLLQKKNLQKKNLQKNS